MRGDSQLIVKVRFCREVQFDAYVKEQYSIIVRNGDQQKVFCLSYWLSCALMYWFISCR